MAVSYWKPTTMGAASKFHSDRMEWCSATVAGRGFVLLSQPPYCASSRPT
jgi:hypothetical protein